MEETKEKLDLLKRKEFVDNFTSIIKNYSKHSFSIAIDGLWGSGKTFTIDMIEESLFNEFLIFKYNAWENDFYEEPLIALLTTMVDHLNEMNKLENSINGITNEILSNCKDKIIAIISKISEQKLGFDIINTIKKTKNFFKKKRVESEIKNSFDQNINLKTAIKEVRKTLTELTSNTKIIFIVDELDRCLPQQAIRTLERTHHIFEGLDKTILLYTFDKNQLTGMLKNIYGTDFNPKQYFKKLFDVTLKLPNGEIDDNIESYIKDYLEDFNLKIEPQEKDLTIQEIINTILPNTPVREIKNIVELVHTAHKITKSKNNYICDYSIALYEIFLACLVCKFPESYKRFSKYQHISPEKFDIYISNNNEQAIQYRLSKLFKGKTFYTLDNSYNVKNVFINYKNNYYRTLLFWYFSEYANAGYLLNPDPQLSNQNNNYYENNYKFLQTFNDILRILD